MDTREHHPGTLEIMSGDKPHIFVDDDDPDDDDDD